jgi:hypothetical protein
MRSFGVWFVYEIRCYVSMEMGRGAVAVFSEGIHLQHEIHPRQMGLEGIVSKRLGSRYRSGRSPGWLKFKNPAAPAVRREAEEDWGK